MYTRRKLLLAGMAAASSTAPSAENDPATEAKAAIVALARSYAGTGDPDFAKQRAFEPLIDRLLQLRPQPPVAQRIDRVAGAWKQIWGPYNYRGSERVVDPELDSDNIYQVVFAEGYYYNVVPLAPGGDKSRQRIALLRGEYRYDDTQSNVLLVRFTRYPGLSKREPGDPSLFELPALVETGRLQPDIQIVPTWVVRLFFGGGALKEVYTDSDLRILYGAGSKSFDRSALYVMSRVGS